MRKLRSLNQAAQRHMAKRGVKRKRGFFDIPREHTQDRHRHIRDWPWGLLRAGRRNGRLSVSNRPTACPHFPACSSPHEALVPRGVRAERGLLKNSAIHAPPLPGKWRLQHGQPSLSGMRSWHLPSRCRHQGRPQFPWPHSLTEPGSPFARDDSAALSVRGERMP